MFKHSWQRLELLHPPPRRLQGGHEAPVLELKLGLVDGCLDVLQILGVKVHGVGQAQGFALAVDQDQDFRPHGPGRENLGDDADFSGGEAHERTGGK